MKPSADHVDKDHSGEGFSGKQNLFSKIPSWIVPPKNSKTPDDSGQNPKLFWTIFILCALIFIVSRFFIAGSAVDHLHNVDKAEYQMAEKAVAILQGEPYEFNFGHLWGLSLNAYLLAGLLKLKIPITLAMKILAIFISAIGFLPLLYLFLRHVGILAGVVLASFFVFPDLEYLHWSLMLWGSYPEAAHFGLLIISIWAVSLVEDKPWLFVASGLLSGLLVVINPSSLFLPPTLFLMTLLVCPNKSRFVYATAYFLWTVVGFLPRLAWIVLFGIRMKFNLELGPLPSQSMGDLLSSPKMSRLFDVADYLVSRWFFNTPMVLVLILVAIFWILLFSIRSKDRASIWQLVFPVAIGFQLFFISCFPLANLLETRHLIWLFVSGYACLALFFGQIVLEGKSRGRLLFEQIAKYGLWAILLCMNLIRIAPLIQPGELDMIFRFKGMEYNRANIGQIIGPETNRINCLLLKHPEIVQEPALMNGIRIIFPIVGQYHCCLWEQQQRNLNDIHLKQKNDGSPSFFKGIGIGLAVKGMDKETLFSEVSQTFPEQKEFILDGWSLLQGLECK